MNAPEKIELSDTIFVTRTAPRNWEVREYVFTGIYSFSRFLSGRESNSVSKEA